MSRLRKALQMAPKGRKTRFLVLRCGIAVVTGLAIVTIITMGLIVASDADETWHPEMANYAIRFPEDEEMLADLSSRILEQAAESADRAVEEGLADIAPAAGDAVDVDNDSILPPPPVLPEEE